MIPNRKRLLCVNPVGFHRIAYTAWGDEHCSQPVVCAHGFSRNSRDFDPLARAIAQTRSVYCPDAVGRGRSDWLLDRSHYNYDQYFRDAATLAGHVTASAADGDRSDDTLDWIGTSMGGIVGMMLAAQRNTPVRRLVINDIGAQISAASLNRIGAYVRETPVFESLEAYRHHLADIHASFGPLTEAQWQHLAQHSHRRDEHGFRTHYDPQIASAFDNPIDQDVELWDVWSAIRVPTLLIWGTQSDLLSRDTIDRMQAIKPDMQVLEIADAGHAPALMRDAEIDAIRDFISAD